MDQPNYIGTIRKLFFPLLFLALFPGGMINIAAAKVAETEKPSHVSVRRPTSGPASGPWTNFSIADGLASDSIFALDLASNGYLWVGTNQGVSIRAPAGEWLTLTSADGLGGDIIGDIVPDPSNAQQHWFATDGGASLLNDGGNPLNKQSHTWVTFKKSDGLVERYVSAIGVGKDSRIWIGTDFMDTNGDETGYGVSVLNMNGTPSNKGDDTWVTYTTTNSNLPNNVIRDIAVDDAGTVWIATKSGLAAFSSNIWTNYYTGDGLPSNDIMDLAISSNLLWVATKGGIAVLNYNGTPTVKTDDQWMTFTQYNSGLAGNNTSSLTVDSVGRVWVGTAWISGSNEVGAGVSVLDPKGTPFNRNDDNWQTFTTSNGLADNAVRAVMTYGTTGAWFGTRAGLSLLNYGASPFTTSDDTWTTYKSSQRLASNLVYAAASAGAQATWFGTDQGLSLLQYGGTPHNKQNHTWTTFTTADWLPADGIRALVVDSQGRVWIGTNGGLSVRDPRGTLNNKQDDLYISYTTSNGLLSNQINDIAIDGAGRGWIACGGYFEGGLQVLDLGASLTNTYDDTWGNFTSQNSSLPDTFVKGVAVQASDKVWVATTLGAARLNHAGTPFNKNDDNWTVYKTNNSGLASDNVRDVAVDSGGNAWFALAINGVSLLTSGNSWVNFVQADGLAFDSVNTVAVDRTGKSWFGTDGGGVSVLDHKGTLTSKSDDAWTTYAGGTTLLSGNVLAIVFDQWGQAWLGTFGGGASVYSSGQIGYLYLPLIRR